MESTRWNAHVQKIKKGITIRVYTIHDYEVLKIAFNSRLGVLSSLSQERQETKKAGRNRYTKRDSV